MTTPINLTQLKKRIETTIGPIGYIAWDDEERYFQVYGDNGTICETSTEELASLIAPPTSNIRHSGLHSTPINHPSGQEEP
jgi:hypothetical protein